jgi:hypothetical protein
MSLSFFLSFFLLAYNCIVLEHQRQEVSRLFYALRYVVYVRKYCGGERSLRECRDFDVYTRFHFLECKRKWVLERGLSACTCTSVAPEGLDGFYSYLVFKNSVIIG